LFRGVGGGRFEDATIPSASGDQGYGQGCAVGDFDADGFPDLYITNYGDDVLLHNCGDGTFHDVTHSARVSDAEWSTGAAWFDADADGDLDLYVVNYMDVSHDNLKVCLIGGVPAYCGPGDYNGVPNRMYVNQGDGAFIESAEQLGLAATNGKGLAVAALDLDDDLLAEVYVGNDMTANFLFTRTRQADASPQPRPYLEIASLAGCAVSETGDNEASMGIACADFDGDSRTDIFLTHYYRQKNTLYRNLGGLSFSDESRKSRIAALTFLTLGFGTVALDYDRDGAADLFLANGHVLGPNYTPNAMRPQLLRNDGAARFEDFSDQAGVYFQQPWLGRGAAGGDFDDDGDLDIAVSHLYRPAALLRNDTPAEGRFLGIDLRPRDRSGAVGGRVVVRLGDRTWTRPIVAGGSYLSSNDPRLLFGLGDADGPAQVEVYWPSGLIDRFEDLALNQYWVLMEGKAPQPWSLPNR
jgi:hypothetical protein